MKAKRWLNKSIWYWLILVFSWSGMSVQENRAITFQQEQSRRQFELYRITNKQNTRNYPFKLATISQSETNDLYFNSSYTLAPSKDFNPSHKSVQEDTLRDQPGYSNKKRILVLRKAQPKQLLSHLEKNQNQSQTSEASISLATDETLRRIPPPSNSMFHGGHFLFLLAAGSVRFLYKRYYKIKKGLRMTRKRKTKQQVALPRPQKILKTPEATTTIARDKPRSGPSPELVDRVLKNLERFEREKGFLDKELNLYNLAAELGTNRWYLSRIFNEHKKMPFPYYVKKLRILNAKKRLFQEPKLHIYDMDGLAGEFGFKSGRAFSDAFLEIVGHRPSRFLGHLGDRGNSPGNPG